MRVLLAGFSSELLGALGGVLQPRSVVLLEEREVFERRRVAEQLRSIDLVGRIVHARYIQSREYRAAAEAEHAQAAFDAVVAAIEYAVPAAADLAERFGLPGAGAGAGAVYRDKVLLRASAERAGIHGPRWREACSVADCASFATEHGDMVLKPADRGGSLGVQLLGPGADLGAAWELAHDDERDLMLCRRPLARRFLVEERLRGPEYSVECLVRDGAVVFASVTAKHLWDGPYPVERGHDVPADLPEAETRALVDSMSRLARATSFGTGILHGEWIRTESGPALVECAARLPGDHITLLVNRAYDVNVAALLLRLLAGRDVELPAAPRRGAAIRFIGSDRPGRLAGVEGVEAARAIPGVERVFVKGPPGRPVHEVRFSLDRLGYAIAVAPTPAEAGALAERAIAEIRLVVEGG